MSWAGLRAVLVTVTVLALSAVAVPATALDDAAMDATRLRDAWQAALEAWVDARGVEAEARALARAADRRAADAVTDRGWIQDELLAARSRLDAAAGARDAAVADLGRATAQLERATAAHARRRIRIDGHAAAIYKHGVPALGPIESLLRSDQPAAYVLHHRVSEAILQEDDRAVRRARRTLDASVATFDRAAIDASVAIAVWEHHQRELAALTSVDGAQTGHVRAAQAGARSRRHGLQVVARDTRERAVDLDRLEGELLTADPTLAASLTAGRRAADETVSARLAESYPFLDDAPDQRPATMPSILGYHCPVADGTFTNDWAFPRPGGRSHEGTDIFAPRHAPVVAVAAGEVVQVDAQDSHDAAQVTGDLGGRTVTVQTEAGERWYYAHLETIADGVVQGATVAAGQQLGTNGDSGNAGGGDPHLHLGRTWLGEPVNPWPSLAVACG
ncbi:MAG: M23 family metallopeptidase [Actinobacteria bacterium]|nr:M23 family metallopeptidase [Actinomycetota bacterium]